MAHCGPFGCRSISYSPSASELGQMGARFAESCRNTTSIASDTTTAQISWTNSQQGRPEPLRTVPSAPVDRDEAVTTDRGGTEETCRSSNVIRSSSRCTETTAIRRAYRSIRATACSGSSSSTNPCHDAINPRHRFPPQTAVICSSATSHHLRRYRLPGHQHCHQPYMAMGYRPDHRLLCPWIRSDLALRTTAGTCDGSHHCRFAHRCRGQLGKEHSIETCWPENRS